MKTNKASASKVPLSFETLLGQFKICVLSEETVSKMRKIIDFSDNSLAFQSIFLKARKKLNSEFALAHEI